MSSFIRKRKTLSLWGTVLNYILTLLVVILKVILFTIHRVQHIFMMHTLQFWMERWLFYYIKGTQVVSCFKGKKIRTTNKIQFVETIGAKRVTLTSLNSFLYVEFWVLIKTQDKVDRVGVGLGDVIKKIKGTW